MIIGITGGTGCGKTTALQAIRELGGIIIDCDAVYHVLLQTDRKMLAAIEARFPGTVIDGVLDRKKLGPIVFSDDQALKDLNAITHKAVKEKVIHIIGINSEDHAVNGKYTKETTDWLEEEIQIALEDNPYGPIFVMCHQTLANTTYGSGWGSGNTGALYDVLKPYQQVIYLAGHSHFPTENERSIMQKDFTCVDLPSLQYTSVETKADGTGSVSAPDAFLSQGGMLITINATDTAHYLVKKLEAMQKNGSAIDIDLGNGEKQTLYYEDSVLLKQLSYFPYIQLLVMTLFALIAYIGLVSVKRAEQNKVWVGLSKETAHQLGTPISSLMAWVELLKTNDNIDTSIVADMDKDVKRLSTIAERFSKIGSIPDKELIYINELIEDSCNYMSTRISSRVKLNLHLPQDAVGTMACQSLIEWVIENLCKNAVDAMGGEGEINVTLSSDSKHIYIDVSDTGKGIARKDFDNIFKPGYTTKKRGWGLGLTLAKRIVEEYHKGHIYVKESEIGIGTTIRIELHKTA